jgi:hypothetical protein
LAGSPATAHGLCARTQYLDDPVKNNDSLKDGGFLGFLLHLLIFGRFYYALLFFLAVPILLVIIFIYDAVQSGKDMYWKCFNYTAQQETIIVTQGENPAGWYKNDQQVVCTRVK